MRIKCTTLSIRRYFSSGPSALEASESCGPSGIYLQKIAKKLILPDKHQEPIIAALQDVYTKVDMQFGLNNTCVWKSSKKINMI